MNSEIKASDIKGIPVADVLKELKKGSYYDSICHRYPALNDEDIRNVVRFRNKNLIPALLKKSCNHKAIAKEFGISVSLVWYIKKKLKEEKQMRKKWGNLSTGEVNRIKKAFHCENLKELVKKALSRDQVSMTRGIGGIAVAELEKAGAFRHSPPPAILFDDEIPSPKFITKASHYLNALFILNASVKFRQVALFVDLIVNAGRKLHPAKNIRPFYSPFDPALCPSVQ
ncbi:MAG: DUF433 domain-containing protein [Elusimicrobiota bacterium]|nr:DUF433 domain-containing protein [Elusimicrobiota bacterium]